MLCCVYSGINVRYLGTVTSMVDKQPSLGYLQVLGYILLVCLGLTPAG